MIDACMNYYATTNVAGRTSSSRHSSQKYLCFSQRLLDNDSTDSTVHDVKCTSNISTLRFSPTDLFCCFKTNQATPCVFRLLPCRVVALLLLHAANALFGVCVRLSGLLHCQANLLLLQPKTDAK
jgi:hypothetical protein